MSLIANCLEKLVKAGRITERAARDALALHEGVMGRLDESMGPTSADAGAALETAKIMAHAAREKKLRVAKNAIRLDQVQQRMENHPKGKVAGLIGAMGRDIYDDAKTPGERIHVDKQTEVIRNHMLAIADPFVSAYRSKAAGLSQNMEGMFNVIRESFGEDTGDALAKEAWKAFDAGSKYGVERFKREGGTLSVLEDWGRPQFWDTARISSFGAQSKELVNDLMREYEAGNIKVMSKTGQGETPRAAVQGQLEAMHRDIIVGQGGGANGLNNQLRTIRFQNAESYLRLMKKYGPGQGGMYNMMLGHFNSMAREIALTEIFGPNYRANFKVMHDLAKADDAMRNASKGGIRRRLKLTRLVDSPYHAEKMFQYLTGDLSIVEGDMLAGVFGGLRNMATASRLGSAIGSAIPGDLVTSVLAAKQNGIPATRLLARVAKDISLNGDMELANQLNLVSSAIMDSALGAKRFEDEIVGTGITGKLAETVIRAQGLQAWTEMLKRAFSMEFMGLIGRQSDNEWGKLDKSFRGFLERYGFTDAEWDEIRAAGVMEVEGSRYFDPKALDNRRLSDRLMGAIFDERQFAVIEPDARIKAFTQVSRRGTWFGEMARSAAMFKSFPMTVITTHLMRAMSNGPIEQRAYRTVGYLTAMTVGGAVAMQASSLITGKDPMNMEDPQFWMASFIRGGGMGLYADLVYSLQTRGEAGAYEFVAGPVLGTGASFLADVAQGKMDGRALAKYMKAFTPGSTLWFSRAATDRMIFDQIHALLDSDYRQSFARHENRIRKEFGQRFWWKRGEVMPSRPPDFGAALNR